MFCNVRAHRENIKFVPRKISQFYYGEYESTDKKKLLGLVVCVTRGRI